MKGLIRGKSEKRGYHHHDLRRALMDAALAFLEANDITRLSMQVLARAAGVSAGAPYHHFADKEAIIAALATEGFELLLARIAERDWNIPAPDAIAELASGYLDFASHYPTHYRLMYLRELSDRAKFPELHLAGGQVLAHFVGVVRRGLPGAPATAAMSRALSTFALLHGFAELEAANVLATIPGAPAVASQRAHLVERAVHLVLD
jgi:AcrR family transcriptional regulator